MFAIFLFGSAPAQQLTEVVALSSTLSESSGLIFLDQRLISHNDSGGEAALYEIDTLTGNISRKVIIANVNNIDWEDICMDSNFIYIGDFGNNSGSRTNLRIYRVPVTSYLNASNDTVYADTIQITYADQIDFTPSSYSTNYDAEALISFEDSLYIFTKNWGDYRTNVYSVSKQPGSYSINRRDSLDAQGLITGGVYNSDSNVIVLTGYTFTDPFIIELSQFSGNLFSNGLVQRSILDPGGSIQIESVTHFAQDQYYLTSEDNPTGNAALLRLETHAPNGINEKQLKMCRAYPNPANGRICLDGPDSDYNFNLYSGSGALVLCKRNLSSLTTIDVSAIDPGFYIVEIKWKSSVQRIKIILE